MILVYPLLLLAAGVVVARAARRGRGGGSGPRWFGAWAAAGALFTVSLLTGLGVGLLLLPFAALLLLAVARRAPQPAEALGFVAGIGLASLLVADRNGGDASCGSASSCGGIDPTPWLIAGLALAAAAVCGYAVVRRRERKPPRTG